MLVWSCNNCHYKKGKRIAFLERKGYKFSVRECQNCGLISLFPLPSRQVLKAYYEKHYKKAFKRKDLGREKRRVDDLQNYIKRGKILDVGCSLGFFLEEVRKRGRWQCFGTEYSKKAAECARKQFGLSVFVGEIKDALFSNEYFDVITMHSTLEHTLNPQMVIRNVYRKLKPGGLFIFNVPNIESFEYRFSQLLGRQFEGFIFEHLYYFTPRAIKQMVEKKGFKIIKMTSRQFSSLEHLYIKPYKLITWLAKLFLEHTEIGGRFKKGNVLYVYAQKT